MNDENKDIINRFLLIGDKFMPEMHLWDPKTGKYSACGPFTRHKQRINDFTKDGKLSHILNILSHDSAYAKYKDRLNRKKSDVVLKNKALEIAMNPKINGYQRGLSSMVYNFFDKKTKGYRLNNEILAEELHKPIIKKFKRRKFYSSFKDNIWGIDLADMSLINKFNKGIKYLFVLLIYLVDIHGLFL